jgi:hypothetical protein
MATVCGKFTATSRSIGDKSGSNGRLIPAMP